MSKLYHMFKVIHAKGKEIRVTFAWSIGSESVSFSYSSMIPLLLV